MKVSTPISNDENVPPPLSSNFSTTAPATPPATPAVIHYRGASFDLVNPHDSLLFHDIETPTRDLDSIEYSPSRSAEEPLLQAEMAAPRRALYTNLDAAYHSIRLREAQENGKPEPNPDTPVPPIPAYLGPYSSGYSTASGAYDSSFAVSPLKIDKAKGFSRTSLKDLKPIKQLTKAFTRSSRRDSDPDEQELKNLPSPVASPASSHFKGDYPRPLDQSYATTFSPVDEYQNRRDSVESVESIPYIPGKLPRLDGLSGIESKRTSSAPLASMVPDESTLEAGRGQRISVSASVLEPRPYYEEVESLYRSSSVYEGGAAGGIPPSLYSKRETRSFGLSAYDDQDVTSPYANRESVYSAHYVPEGLAVGDAYVKTPRGSSHQPRYLVNDAYRRSQAAQVENENTDTLSKFIDQYDSQDATRSSQNTSLEDEEQRKRSREQSLANLIKAARARQPVVARTPGSPPHMIAPLEPAFEYDDIFDEDEAPVSDPFSPASSYGDTRNLLGISGNIYSSETGGLRAPVVYASPPAGSSSYSQLESQSPAPTPQEALDQAEQIFEQAAYPSDSAGWTQAGVASKPRSNTIESTQIPAMWSRRNSGSILRSRSIKRQSAVSNQDGEDWETVGAKSRRSVDDDKDDWETIGNKSRNSRGEGMFEGHNYDLANYPASPDMYPIFPPLNHYGPPPGTYNESSSPYAQEDPFASSPPHFIPDSSDQSGHRRNMNVSTDSQEPLSPSLPVLPSPTTQDRPYFFTPWVREAASPYALSDKETQELLNSGPNDDIFYEDMAGDRRSKMSSRPRNLSVRKTRRGSQLSGEAGVLSLSPLHENYNNVVLGQSSSPEAKDTVKIITHPDDETSKPKSPKEGRRVGFPGFYSDPAQTSSRSVIRTARPIPGGQTVRPVERSPTEEHSAPPKSDRSSIVSGGRRSVSDGRLHRHGRSAVQGQTKLREMVLAPRTASTKSHRSHSTHFSDLMRNDRPPSSVATDAPLQPTKATRKPLEGVRRSVTSVLSPHLRLPERKCGPDEEAQRAKLSWILFGVFAILPPLLIIYRFKADSVVAWITGGRLGSASVTPKRLALHAGVPLNILIVLAIIVPIIVMSV